MKVRNRDGQECQISYDEIKHRVETLCTEAEKRELDIDRVVIQTINGIYDGITTSELDELSASVCANMQSVHFLYDTLAGKILASNMHKNVRRLLASHGFAHTFSGKIAFIEARHAGTFNPRFLAFVELHAEALDATVKYARDYSHNYFSTKTLQRAYLMSVDNQIVETAQDMWMRVSVAIHCADADGPKAAEALALVTACYDNMSLGFFTHASPTLFNAGTQFEQMSSCYLLGTHDSIDGIFKTVSDCARISKWAGGIGVHVSNIRAKGSRINSTNGRSDGIIPMLKVYNETARYCNQSGKRKGSIAVYLEPWHADVWEFLELRQNTGAETERARDLFLALWVPDEFMRRVRDGEDWYLMSPDRCPGLADAFGPAFTELYEDYVRRGMFVKKLPARALWQHVLKNLIETGTPYVCFKDHVNRKSNHQNLGTIKSSNLCVAPETRVLTSRGYRVIKDLKDQQVEVWNGKAWSKTVVRQTGVDQPMLRVTFGNGETLDCTAYHKFYVLARNVPADVPSEDGGWEAAVGKTKTGHALRVVRACDLAPGMELQRLDAPLVADLSARADFKYAYTHGLFCADGTYEGDFNDDMYEGAGSRNRERHPDLVANEEKRGVRTTTNTTPRITLYGEKQQLLQFVERRPALEPRVDDAHDNISVFLPVDIAPKYAVPLEYANDIKLRWLEGLCDGDGSIARFHGYDTLYIASAELPFLREVRLLLNTLGVDPTLHSPTQGIPPCLLVIAADLFKLRTLGFAPKRLRMGDMPAEAPGVRRCHVQIVGVDDIGRTDDTYCFGEPLEHRGVFNGILTGQCAEVVEYSDADTYAVCNLASIAVNRFVRAGATPADLDLDAVYDFPALHAAAKLLTVNLNKIIDSNMYPTPETRQSNLAARPIGIGIQGLGDMYCMLKLQYDEPRAMQLDAEIVETIYHGALEASAELAQAHGAYACFPGSPFSQGILQFDMGWPGVHFGAERGGAARWDWAALKADIVRHGTRNSLVTALMPTASTSQILGNCECFELFHANVFKRTTIAGEFMVINRYLMQDLMDIGMWSDAMREQLLSSDGSVQNIAGIPDALRRVYKTVWEVPQRAVIDHAVHRAPFVDQSQSMNLFFGQPNTQKLSSALLYGWAQGLKTGCYYLRSRPAKEAIKFGLIGGSSAGVLMQQPQAKGDAKAPGAEEELAAVCTRAEGCVMCSG